MAQVASQIPILLLISFDGFRHDYLSPALTPNLFDISKQSTLGHMESLYITKTFPNHFSMVTGLYEETHQIINNKMFDPRLNETFKPGVESEAWWNPNANTVPIWVANQLVDDNMVQKRHSASMMYPGSSTPFRDTLPTHLKLFDMKRNWTESVETVISWLTDPERPANFVSIYFDDPDSTAHTHGPWGKATLEALRRVDSAAGYLLKRLRDVELAGATNIIFVSDHGMAEVKNIIYLSDIMDTSGFEMFGNSPDWSVFVKPDMLHQKNKIFRQLLSISKKNHFRIYKRADIPPEFHYSKSPRIGDFFILVDEKYDLFKDRPNKTKNLPEIWGNHGWKPTNADMRPLFMAHGPSFRSAYYHSEPFPNIDLFPLMMFLLGIPSEKYPNNGTLAHIIDIIDIGHFEEEGPFGAVKPISGLALVASSSSAQSHYPVATHTFGLYLILITFLALLGVLFTLFASSNKPKFKPNVDFDDLAPGLNIDLAYYLTDSQADNRRKRKKEEELLSLLST